MLLRTQVHLGRQHPALLGGRGAADNGCVTVKVLCNLLQGRVARLDVEEVDDGEFDAEPDALAMYCQSMQDRET